jgi:hypothetical protein
MSSSERFPEARDPGERLSEDDQATQRESEFLSFALLNQQLAAAREPAAVQGVCTNCGEHCLPLAVYCDADCRQEHNRRLRIARQRGA